MKCMHLDVKSISLVSGGFCHQVASGCPQIVPASTINSKYSIINFCEGHKLNVYTDSTMTT